MEVVYSTMSYGVFGSGASMGHFTVGTSTLEGAIEGDLSGMRRAPEWFVSLEKRLGPEIETGLKQLVSDVCTH